MPIAFAVLLLALTIAIGAHYIKGKIRASQLAFALEEARPARKDLPKVRKIHVYPRNSKNPPLREWPIRTKGICLKEVHTGHGKGDLYQYIPRTTANVCEPLLAICYREPIQGEYYYSFFEPQKGVDIGSSLPPLINAHMFEAVFEMATYDVVGKMANPARVYMPRSHDGLSEEEGEKLVKEYDLGGLNFSRQDSQASDVELATLKMIYPLNCPPERDFTSDEEDAKLIQEAKP